MKTAGNKQYFDNFQKKLQIELEEVCNKITYYNNYKEVLIAKFKINSSWIDRNTNVKVSDILKGEVSVNNIKLTLHNFREGDKTRLDVSEVQLWVSAYNRCIKIKWVLNDSKKHILFLRGITKCQYQFLLQNIYSQISNRILKGNAVHFGKMGVFSFLPIRTKFDTNAIFRTIDWKATNIRKAELIAVGKIPYDKETAPDGIKYFMYNGKQDVRYMLMFRKKSKDVIPSEYHFKPAYKGTPTLRLAETMNANDVYNSYLPIIDKLSILLKIDENYHLNYLKNV
jgi:hypothetical protein